MTYILFFIFIAMVVYRYTDKDQKDVDVYSFSVINNDYNRMNALFPVMSKDICWDWIPVPYNIMKIPYYVVYDHGWGMVIRVFCRDITYFTFIPIIILLDATQMDLHWLAIDFILNLYLIVMIYCTNTINPSGRIDDDQMISREYVSTIHWRLVIISFYVVVAMIFALVYNSNTLMILAEVIGILYTYVLYDEYLRYKKLVTNRLDRLN